LNKFQKIIIIEVIAIIIIIFFLSYFDVLIYESRDDNVPDCRRGDPTITQEKCLELALEYLDKIQKEKDNYKPPPWHAKLVIFCGNYLEKGYGTVDSCMQDNVIDFVNSQ